MSKKVRNLIIALVAALLLVGVLVALVLTSPGGENVSSQTSSASTISLLAAQNKDVKTLTVTNSQDTFTLNQLSENEWEVPELNGLPVYKNNLVYLVSDFSTVDAQKQVENPGELADYGLAQPRATVTTTHQDGTRHTFRLGDKTPDGDGVYMTMDQDAGVYVMDSLMEDSFLKTKLDLLDTTLVSLEVDSDQSTAQGQSTAAEIEKFSFAGTSRQVPFVMDRVTEEEAEASQLMGMAAYTVSYNGKTAACDSNKLDGLLSACTNINARDAVAIRPSGDQLAQYGLDKPQSVLTFTYKSVSYTISLGNYDEEEACYYAMKEGVDVVYRLSETAAPWAKYQYTDMLSTLLFMADIKDVASVSIQGQGIDSTYEITYDDEAQSVTKVVGDGKEFTSETAVSDFKKLYQMLISGQVEEVAPSDPPEGTAPALTITFRYRDSSRSADVVTLIPNGTRRHFFAVNGEGIFNVREAFTQAVVKAVQDFQAGKTPSTEY